MLTVKLSGPFWEVIEEESQQIRYTCLKEEDARDFQTRHANDPPKNSRRSLSHENFNQYLYLFGLHGWRIQDYHPPMRVLIHTRSVRELWCHKGLLWICEEED